MTVSPWAYQFWVPSYAFLWKFYPYSCDISSSHPFLGRSLVYPTRHFSSRLLLPRLTFGWKVLPLLLLASEACFIGWIKLVDKYLPYFLIRFPKKLVFFGFENCCRFKHLPQYFNFLLIKLFFPAETIQWRKLFKGENYMRKYGI